MYGQYAVTTDYSGQFATVTDQAGKRKKYQYDAFGRLFNVREDPDGSNWTTDYRYDVMDHLTSVTQGYCPHCQWRTFDYNSPGELTRAVNPESGATNYSLYDGAGNLVTKTDANGVTTTYAYDAVNRLLSKTYNDGTPPVTYTYDDPNVPYSKGRLTRVDNQVSTVNYIEYDPLGRVKQSNQQVAVC